MASEDRKEGRIEALQALITLLKRNQQELKHKLHIRKTEKMSVGNYAYYYGLEVAIIKARCLIRRFNKEGKCK